MTDKLELSVTNSEGEGVAHPREVAPGLSITDSIVKRLASATSEATRRAYRTDWADFSVWCAEQRVAALPATPETIAGYVDWLATAHKKVSTIKRRLSSISVAHDQAGFRDSPAKTDLVRRTVRGIGRDSANAGMRVRRVMALTTDDIRAMVEATSDDLRGVRDRALLLMAFAGAFRRSELVGLTASDVTVTDRGLLVTIRRSKTDQIGEGRDVAIERGRHTETCPVRAYQAWKSAAGIATGPVFLSIDKGGNLGKQLNGRTVARLVQRLAASVTGIEPSAVAGHSLRSGFATTAAGAGATSWQIARTTGHKSESMVARYVRQGDIWRASASGMLGL